MLARKKLPQCSQVPQDRSCALLTQSGNFSLYQAIQVRKPSCTSRVAMVISQCLFRRPPSKSVSHCHKRRPGSISTSHVLAEGISTPATCAMKKTKPERTCFRNAKSRKKRKKRNLRHARYRRRGEQAYWIGAPWWARFYVQTATLFVRITSAGVRDESLA